MLFKGRFGWSRKLMGLCFLFSSVGKVALASLWGFSFVSRTLRLEF